MSTGYEYKMSTGYESVEDYTIELDTNDVEAKTLIMELIEANREADELIEEIEAFRQSLLLTNRNTN